MDKPILKPPMYQLLLLNTMFAIHSLLTPPINNILSAVQNKNAKIPDRKMLKLILVPPVNTGIDIEARSSNPKLPKISDNLFNCLSLKLIPNII